MSEPAVWYEWVSIISKCPGLRESYYQGRESSHEDAERKLSDRIGALWHFGCPRVRDGTEYYYRDGTPWGSIRRVEEAKE